MGQIKYLNGLLKNAVFFQLLVSLSLSQLEAGNPEFKNKVSDQASCAILITSICDHTLHAQDLDNTVMKPAQMLGSDQWYSEMLIRFQREGLSKDEAINKALERWMRVQRVTKMVPVEPFIPNLITYLLQGRDHLRDVALTARNAAMADVTIQQLASMGIDFSTRNPFGGNKRIEIRSEKFSDPIVIQGGIIFVGPRNDKGRVLAFLLDPANGYNGYAPGFERIVFADDKLHHAESVLHEVRAAHPEMSVYSFRIGAADPEVAAYDRRIADIQWDEFEKSGTLISDEEARNRLPNDVPPELLGYWSTYSEPEQMVIVRALENWKESPTRDLKEFGQTMTYHFGVSVAFSSIDAVKIFIRRIAEGKAVADSVRARLVL